ncbi:MAG: hypothetical protein Q8P46_17775 [Hyphomicrobiales bacterium]|nr:hypothetical protein [Hyphomicrobiales bacterium]
MKRRSRSRDDRKKGRRLPAVLPLDKDWDCASLFFHKGEAVSDRPIHLLEYSHICRPQPHSEPSITVPVWITQSSLDGLQALIHFCEGFEKSGKGCVTGWFEITMFYRTIQGCIRKADNAAREKQNGTDAAHCEGKDEHGM